MNYKNILAAALVVAATVQTYADSRIVLTQPYLMHEMRGTEQPLDGSTIHTNPLTLMWPLAELPSNEGGGLDGIAQDIVKAKPKVYTYQVMLSSDPMFASNCITASSPYAFYNIGYPLADGKWYWKYAYISEEDGTTEWSKVFSFEVAPNTPQFVPPTFTEFVHLLPTHHPRVMVDKEEWDGFRAQAKDKIEYKWIIKKANSALKTPIKSLSEQIDVSGLEGIDNEVNRKARLTREARKVVDAEENSINNLIRAYLLTHDTKYATCAINHIKEMLSWDSDPNFVGDFNESTIISLASMAYDACYDQLSEADKTLLLDKIAVIGDKMHHHYLNHLEHHIADNHVWQMTLRILTFASFATYGDIPEAAVWADYCYNIWQARFPGLNQDGAWHNGDSYFQVNARTLIEVPYFYSRVSGFNFFADPWYNKNALYAIYNQPPFSKSAGNGSSHRKVEWAHSVRVGYLDALGKVLGNSYATDYAAQALAENPDVLSSSFRGKSGDLAWFRLQCTAAAPEVTASNSLATLPNAKVFPQSGLVNWMSNWSDINTNAMLMFRSSPYGSTSHAIANQNSYNTFYGGKPLFYSAGHHISFIDKHSIYCHRGTKAHNTILVNGMGQRIGTDGYGWLPRSYEGETISYALGDASNAYGKVESELWLERGRLADIHYTPANGWDENHLKTYRRHMVQLGGADLVFIYDELEADKAVDYTYQLHSTYRMDIKKQKGFTKVSVTDGNGTSDAYLMGSKSIKTKRTDKFFYPAVDFMGKAGKGGYENHWHFTATSPKGKDFRFATIISTHAASNKGIVPTYNADGSITVGEWTIVAELDATKRATFTVTNSDHSKTITYDDTTTIVENGIETVLVDAVPQLEQ